MQLQYLATFIVIVISGNPTAQILGRELTSIIVFISLIYLWTRRRYPIENTALAFTAVIASLAAVHLFSFGPLVLPASLGLLVNIGIGVFAATVIEDFFRRFVRIMALLACVSFIFYFPSLLGFDVESPLSFLQISIEEGQGQLAIRHIGIHNFHAGETRNCGMFWEPGAFAGYLVLALFIAASTIKRHTYFFWEIGAIVLGLITTQSTMGYISGLFVLLYYILNKFFKESLVSGLPFLPILLSVFAGLTYISVTEIDFIGDKIQEQMAITVTGVDRHAITRFGNALYDLDSIRQRPLVGWSATPETRYAVDPELAEIIGAQGVAITGFWVRFGAIGWIALFIGIYRAAFKPNQSQVDAFFSVVIIGALLLGEQYTNYALIYAMLVCRKSSEFSN